MRAHSMMIRLAALFFLVGPAVSIASSAESTGPERPNFVLFLCDNLGYGDVGCLGSKLHRTPHIDRLAKEGCTFTSFYVTSGVCTPSRASFMTGCYPRRVNLHVSDTGGSVLQPVSPKGLNPEEVTVAEVLKQRGYATAIIGKWHLGDQPAFLPTRQGFDEFFGIPYSDDMTARQGKPWPSLPLMRNEQVIEAPVDRDLLTKRYTEEVVRFITAHRNDPFFIYLPHAMPGSTNKPFASDAFRGKSANGAYGDSVEELDWSTGEILRALQALGLDEKTLVVWTSDNGAPKQNPPQGSNLPFTGWGYSTTEGGMRVPCFVRWPGKIPADTRCDELCSSLDILPTFAHLAGGEVPRDRIIDGKDISNLMLGKPGARSPYDAFYYYHRDQLQAVRSGNWKLYLPLEAKEIQGRTRPRQALQLYDLQSDQREEHNLADKHPDIVARLTHFADQARADLGDVGETGQGQRKAGWVNDVTPRNLVEN